MYGKALNQWLIKSDDLTIASFFRVDNPVRQLVFRMLCADGLIMHMDLWIASNAEQHLRVLGKVQW